MASSSSRGGSRKPGGALSSIISSLTHDGIGEEDRDLDRQIADMLLKEAQQAERRAATAAGGSSSSSSRAPDPSRAGSTNKRFLASVIRNVDGHNRAVIRAQEEEAREGRRQRGDEDEERDGLRIRGRSERSPPQRTKGRGTGGMRGWSDDDEEQEEQDESSLHRDSGPSLQIQGSSSRSSKFQRDSHHHHHSSRRHRYRSRSPRRRADPGPFSPPIPSKMDRYFTSTYDPLFDVSVEGSTDPKTGLIAEGGWDGLMERVEEARRRESEKEDKRSRRRREEDGEARSKAKRRDRDVERDRGEKKERRRSRREEGSEEEDEEEDRRRRRRKRHRDDDERGEKDRRRSSGHRKAGDRKRRSSLSPSPGPKAAPATRAWDLGKAA